MSEFCKECSQPVGTCICRHRQSGEREMNEKLNEILSDVWHRSISADEGFDAICDLIDKSAEIARLEAENKSLKDKLAECRKDAERYRWLRDNYHGFERYRSKVIPYVNLDSDIDQAIAKGKEEMK